MNTPSFCSRLYDGVASTLRVQHGDILMGGSSRRTVEFSSAKLPQRILC